VGLPMSSSPVIEVSAVSKTYAIYSKPADRLRQMASFGRKRYYSEHWALKGVSFTVEKGQTLGIVGRNGSGKSTLLQIIAGTLSASSGTAHVRGRVAALLELGAGFNPEYTGRENVYLNAALLGLSREQTEERFAAIAAFADIGDYLEQPVKTYSSGMFVRLAFAVVAHVDAEVLIVDEALSVGDVFFAQKCLRYLNEFKAQGGVICFVSHDSGAVLSLCDKVVVLNQGAVTFVGAPKPAMEHYLKQLYTPDAIQSASKENTNLIAGKSVVEATSADLIYPKINTADAWGQGGAAITDARFMHTDRTPLAMVDASQAVLLQVWARADRELLLPMVGFHIRNSNGVQIGGSNTLDVQAARAAIGDRMDAGVAFSYTFSFTLPELAPGAYTITVAVGEGSREAHALLHWINDALAFTSAVRGFHGLIGFDDMQHIVTLAPKN
jgi:lipopolysaccharide transport system ATP-binding protein